MCMKYTGLIYKVVMENSYGWHIAMNITALLKKTYSMWVYCSAHNTVSISHVFFQAHPVLWTRKTVWLCMSPQYPPVTFSFTSVSWNEELKIGLRNNFNLK